MATTCSLLSSTGLAPESRKLLLQSHSVADGWGGSDHCLPLWQLAGRLFPREEAGTGRAVARPGALDHTGRWYREETSSGRSRRGPRTSRAGGDKAASGSSWTLRSTEGQARLSSAITGGSGTSFASNPTGGMLVTLCDSCPSETAPA